MTNPVPTSDLPKSPIDLTLGTPIQSWPQLTNAGEKKVTELESLAEQPISKDNLPELPHLAPDAPILHLLSLQHNPSLVNMTTAQLKDFVLKIRTLAMSPQNLGKKLREDSDEIKTKTPRAKSAAQVAKDAKLASLLDKD